MECRPCYSSYTLIIFGQALIHAKHFWSTGIRILKSRMLILWSFLLYSTHTRHYSIWNTLHYITNTWNGKDHTTKDPSFPERSSVEVKTVAENMISRTYGVTTPLIALAMSSLYTYAGENPHLKKEPLVLLRRRLKLDGHGHWQTGTEFPKAQLYATVCRYSPPRELSLLTGSNEKERGHNFIEHHHCL